MKKRFLLGALLITLPFMATAQLVNVDRIQRHQWLIDDAQIQFGSFPDVACEYDTNQTNDALVCGLSADSNTLIVTKKAAMGTNFNFPPAPRPTVVIHSGNAADPNEHIRLGHDGINAVIESGKGSVSIPQGVIAPMNATGLITYEAPGASSDPLKFQAGRNNDNPNHFEFSIPAGSGYGFRIGGADILTIDQSEVGLNGKNISNAGSIIASRVIVDMPDNDIAASEFKQGPDNFLKFVTANGAEAIELGNAATNPDLVFLGLGTVSLPSLNINGGILNLGGGNVINGGAATFTSVSGDGSGLTSLNASNVSSGTLPLANLTDGPDATHALFAGGGGLDPLYRAIGDADVPDNITVNLAMTATALAADPADCGPNQFANAINASGTLGCAPLADPDVPDGLTISGGSINNTVIGGAVPAVGNFSSLDVSDADITNVGAIGLDSVNADAAVGVSYHDVNIFELTQEDVGVVCAVGQLRLDTGGVTVELCYCQVVDGWVCAAMAAGPVD